MWQKLQIQPLTDTALVVGLGLLVAGIGIGLKEKLSTEKVELIKAKVAPTVIQVNSKVTFDVAGEVIKPGVYILEKGGRVGEAIFMAGGLSANADRAWVEKNINQAEKISDGMKIYIPAINEKEVLGVSVSKSTKINLNTATLSDLDTLPGVGKAIAQRIIDYREANGGFKDINELKLVSGIGDKMWEKLKEMIEI